MLFIYIAVIYVLLDRFQNGYMYKFFPGRLITVDDMLDDTIRRYLLLLHNIIFYEIHYFE